MFPLLSSVGTTMSATLEDEQINLRPTSGRGNLHRAATTSTTTGTAVGQEKKHTSAHAPIHVNLRIHTGFAKKRNNRDPNPSKITTLAGTVIEDDPALLGAMAACATAGKTLTAGISPGTVSGQRQCASGLAPDPRNGKIIKNSGGASITIDGLGVGSKIIAGGDDDTIVKFAPVAILDQNQRSGGISSESLGVVLIRGCGDQSVFTVSEQSIATHGTVDVDDCNQAMKENCPTVNTTTNGAAESNLGRMEEENNSSGCVFVHCDGREDREDGAGMVKTVKVVDVAQSNKNGSECATGSKCNINTSPLVLITGIMVVFLATVVLQPSDYTICHFYDGCETVSHAILAPNELDVGGGTTIQAKSDGVTCPNGATTVLWLVVLMLLVECALDTGLR